MLPFTLALDDGPRVAIQVIASIGLVLVVLGFMWRLPASGERFFGWAPPLALMSAWAGLLGVIFSVLLWIMPMPDLWITGILLVLDPAAMCAGILVMWIYRHHQGVEETIHMQLTQARVGILLALVAVTVGYLYVMTHKAPFTPVGG
jgi:hypothetical protein